MKNLDDIKPLLSEQEIVDLEEITKRIKSTCQVRMIILYGSHARGEQINPTYKGDKKSDYDILVIPMKEGAGLINDVRDLLRNLFHDIDKTVSCLVQPTSFVNHCLAEGQYFYTDIKNEGVYLYKKGSIELAEKQELTPQRQLEIAEQYYKQYFDIAEGAFEGYEAHYEKNRTNWAAFHLQQCFEASYKCVALTLTGYTPKEHLLTALRVIASKLDKRLNIPFPLDTPEKQTSFDLMDYAYIGGRYDPDYIVTLDQLKQWSIEAQKLIEIIKIVCEEHINKLKTTIMA